MVDGDIPRVEADCDTYRAHSGPGPLGKCTWLDNDNEAHCCNLTENACQALGGSWEADKECDVEG
jgi:hypothetical protein